MSEHDDHGHDAFSDERDDVARDGAVDPETSHDDGEVPSTGSDAVDEVLASVQSLASRPVEEHVAVFEQAHERLRRALDPGHG